MKRRVINYIRPLLPILSIPFICFILYQIATGPTFKLKKVLIIGYPEFFTDTADLRKPVNILTLSTKKLSQQIVKKNLALESVLVSKQWPDTLKIITYERRPLVVYQVFENNIYIDGDGLILPNLSIYANYFYPSLNCLIDQTQMGLKISDKSIISSLYIIKTLIEKTETKVLSLSCENPQLFKIITHKSQIWYSPSQDQEKLVTSLLFLIKQFRIEGNTPEIIDLRFDKPVLKKDIGI